MKLPVFFVTVSWCSPQWVSGVCAAYGPFQSRELADQVVLNVARTAASGDAVQRAVLVYTAATLDDVAAVLRDIGMPPKQAASCAAKFFDTEI